MKKIAFLSVMVLMIVALAGCKKGNVSIKTSEIEANTMLIKSDGVVQVATVEEFNESYYDLDELKEFINENLTEFNQEVGNETAIVLDSLEKKDGNAIMVLEYANMDYYAQFNEVEAVLLTEITSDGLAKLPDTLLNAKEDGSISKSDLTSIEDAKAVILNEAYHLIVSENITYYSNGTLIDENEIQTAADGTVVIY